jgi:hypothetical protein
MKINVKQRQIFIRTSGRLKVFLGCNLSVFIPYRRWHLPKGGRAIGLKDSLRTPSADEQRGKPSLGKAQNLRF